MNLHRFRIFAAIAKYKNESKAADEMHLSQSALSHHLRDLQEQFGTLFIRRGRGLELTKRGQDVLDEIVPLLAGVDSLQSKYGVKRGREKIKPLLVGSSQGPATIVMPTALTQFKQRNPTTDIQLRVSNSPAIQELVGSSDLDLAVITNPSPGEAFHMEPFKRFRLWFFVSASHALAGARTVSVEMLAKYPVVIGRARRPRSRADELLSSLTANGVKLTVLMRCEWPDAVKTVVSCGDAVGVAYWDNVRDSVQSGQFKALDIEGINLSVISYIVYSRERVLSEYGKEFLSFLRSTSRHGNGRALMQKATHYAFVFAVALFGLLAFAFAV